MIYLVHNPEATEFEVSHPPRRYVVTYPLSTPRIEFSMEYLWLRTLIEKGRSRASFSSMSDRMRTHKNKPSLVVPTSAAVPETGDTAAFDQYLANESE
jgi:hypothetical protein